MLSGHSVYRTMLYHLVNLAARLALVPFAWVGLKAVIWGLEEWYRKSELSCDRAGLLAGQDVAAARPRADEDRRAARSSPSSATTRSSSRRASTTPSPTSARA